MLKKIFLLLSLILLVFSLSSQEKETSDYLALADKNYINKNYRESLANYKAALIKNAGSIRANLGYAKSSIALGSRGDAEIGYKKTLELDPNNREAICGLAEILADFGKYKEALDIVENNLKEDPYNQNLLLCRASVLLKSGRKDLALLRLEEARKRVPENLEFRLLLAKVYSANKKFDKAETIVDDLILKYPESPESFIEKSELNFEKLSSSENQNKLMKETYYLLKTALALNGDNIDAKRAIIKNLLWLAKEDNQKYTEAKKYADELLADFPNDPFLQYISGYISFKMNSDEDSSENYGKLLDIEELNEIGRFSAENYAISKLNENHDLRNSLGQYRIVQYLNSKKDFFYDVAYFHLMRAAKLMPSNANLQKNIAEYYYAKNDLYQLLVHLIKARDNDVDDMKIHNRLENVFHRYKQSLIYKEGFADEKGNINFSIFSGPEVFLFDPSPEQGLSSYPDSSLQISSAIKFALGLKNEIRLISGKEEKKIRSLISEKKGIENYTNAIYFSNDVVEYLNQYRKSDNLIRYIGYGSFSIDKNKISVNYKLYDRSTGKFLANINSVAENRNALAEISTRIAQKFATVLPIEGRILKIKSESIILNLGSKHGIKKDSVFSIVRNYNEIAKVKIKVLDDYISEAVPDGKTWSRDLAVKDKVQSIAKE
jgi:predicted Zn-dependent protease